MSKKITKEEVKKSDIFIQLTDKAIGWLEEHWRIIGTILLVSTLSGAGYVGYNMKVKSDEVAAQAELYSLRLMSGKLEKSYNSLDKKKADEAETVEVKNFESHFSKVLAEYTKFFASYRRSNAEKVGYLQLASLFADYDKWGKAKDALVKVVSNTKKENFYFGLLSMKLSQAQMNENNFKEAIQVLEQVSSQPEHRHIHAESLLRIGICYKEQKDNEKAKQYFERVNRDFSESEAAKNAKLFLRLLALKG